MITIKFKLDKGKADKKGNCPIFLQAYFNCQRFKQSSGEKCQPNEWNEKHGRFRSSYDECEEANRSLGLLEERCRKVYREYMDQRIIPSQAQMKSSLTPKSDERQPKQQYLLVPMFEQFCDSLALSDRKSNTVRTYRTTLFRLREYEAHGRCLFADK